MNLLVFADVTLAFADAVNGSPVNGSNCRKTGAGLASSGWRETFPKSVLAGLTAGGGGGCLIGGNLFVSAIICSLAEMSRCVLRVNQSDRVNIR